MTTSANELYGSPEPKISVILPVLNESKYLEEAVKAILDQDFVGEIEIILAVGPSHDGTEVIAHALTEADSRVVVVGKKNGTALFSHQCIGAVHPGSNTDRAVSKSAVAEKRAGHLQDTWSTPSMSVNHTEAGTGQHASSRSRARRLE